MKVTVSTITDEQISQLWKSACGTGNSHRDANPDIMHLCTVALNKNGDFTSDEQHDARGRCAELINAAESSAPGYPADWPRCPSCGDFALDGHITCGRLECQEANYR